MDRSRHAAAPDGSTRRVGQQQQHDEGLSSFLCKVVTVMLLRIASLANTTENRGSSPISKEISLFLDHGLLSDQ